MMTLIHVHTITEPATQGYGDFMWYAMEKLAAKPEFIKLQTYQMFGPGGSVGHGMTMDKMLAELDTSVINVVCDSDTVLLMKNWDEVIRQQFQQVGIFGVTYENENGFSTSNTKIQLYKNIPNHIWMALAPGYPWNTLVTAPDLPNPLPVTTEEMSKIYNLPIGYSVLRDTSWQIAQFLYDHKISYYGLEHLKPSMEQSIVLKGLSDYHEEYHMHGAPFVVHHRGSRKHQFRVHPRSKAFYDAVEAYLTTQLT